MSWQKPKIIINLIDLIKRHKLPVIIVAVATVLSTAGLITFAVMASKLNPVESKAPAARKPPPPPPKYYSPLTGLEVADEATTKRQVRAIMLENSPDSRPQSGLKEAGVVFEAIAEGGITRFLALYQESRPGLIGPVRSLRPYYVDWLAPFDATVSHVGGSKAALDEIRNGTYKDIDQFFNGAYYWRAKDRYAPHNVYTNSDKLDELNNKKGFTSSTFTAWPRKKVGTPLATPNASSIDIPISYGAYNVHYDYDKTTNTYVRSHGSVPHNDRELGRITPSVVIAMKVPMHRGFEDGYREQMTTTGTGNAHIFMDGTFIEATWTKTARKNQITFTDTSGQQIALNPGQTWISVLVPEKSVVWR